MHLVTAATMKQLEDAADDAGLPYDRMMRRAGRAVAREIARRIDPDDKKDKNVVVICGPGNNGGDGLVCAAGLADAGFDVRVAAWLRDSDQWLAACGVRGIPVCHLAGDGDGLDPDCHDVLRRWLARCDVVVDALLGTGLSRPIEGAPASILDTVGSALAHRDAARPSVAAVDVPSGLFADSGQLDPHALRADLTVTFGLPKIGQLTYPGAGALGTLVLDEIGIPEAARRGGVEIGDADSCRVIRAADVRRWLPSRPADGHKGTFGRVRIVAGSRPFTGAAALAAGAAGRSGAGLVTLSCIPTVRTATASRFPEVTYQVLPDDDGTLAPDAASEIQAAIRGEDALLVGCGLSTADGPAAVVRALASDRGDDGPEHVVLDADALNLLATDEQDGTGTALKDVTGTAVLTPHPGEMARLTGRSVDAVQSDRVRIARRSASDWGHVVVLKGAMTVVAAPDGRMAVVPIATSALATAGTGDVLSGMIVALLAGGAAPFEGACAAAAVHALAGALAASRWGERAVVASCLLQTIGPAFLRIDRRDAEPTGCGGPAEGLFWS